MRRIGMLLTVTMIVVGMLAASAAGALAAPNNPGTNSSQPFFNEVSPGQNFGHCQSREAKEPGPANSAQEENPAILTGGELEGSASACVKDPEEA